MRWLDRAYASEKLFKIDLPNQEAPQVLSISLSLFLSLSLSLSLSIYNIHICIHNIYTYNNKYIRRCITTNIYVYIYIRRGDTRDFSKCVCVYIYIILTNVCMYMNAERRHARFQPTCQVLYVYLYVYIWMY